MAGGVYSEVEQMASCGRQRYFRFWGQLRVQGYNLSHVRLSYGTSLT